MADAKDWHKILIFTKSVKLLNMLEFHLNSEGNTIPSITTLGRQSSIGLSRMGLSDFGRVSQAA